MQSKVISTRGDFDFGAFFFATLPGEAKSPPILSAGGFLVVLLCTGADPDGVDGALSFPLSLSLPLPAIVPPLDDDLALNVLHPRAEAEDAKTTPLPTPPPPSMSESRRIPDDPAVTTYSSSPTSLPLRHRRLGLRVDASSSWGAQAGV